MTSVTPIIVDHTNLPAAVEPQNQFFGPWLYNDKLYIIAAEQFQASPTLTSFVRVYFRPYTLVENTPWEELDSENHPELSGFELGVWQDGDGIYTVYNGYVEETIATIFRKFDLDSETWGPVISSFVDATPNSWIHLRKAGDEWIVYYSQGGGSSLGPAMVRKYNGSWTTPVHVSTNVTYGAALQITEGDDGIFHLCWKEDTFFTSAVRTYSRTFEPVTQTLGPVAQVTDLRNIVFPGPGAVWDNKIVISTGFRDNTVFPAIGRVTVAYGSPTEEPTWTNEEITTDGVLTSQWTVVSEDGDLYVWWATRDYIRVSHKSPGESWSTPETWYNDDGLSFYEDDGITLTPWTGSNFFHDLSIVRMNESWNILFSGIPDELSTRFYLHGFGVTIAVNNYCDEAQDLSVMAE